MKFNLNCSPQLTMAEITVQLFNCEFLSDIQFSVEGEIIYAHSLELMKRSKVFESVLPDTCGADLKLIPICDCSYASFLEFMRFIYTDNCAINSDNGLELLKLSIKYKVIKLENQVINKLDSIKWGVELFDYCVVENYQIARKSCEIQFAFNFMARMNSHQFLSLHPDSINTLLKMDSLEKNISEVQIFNGLAEWITNYCKIYRLSLADCRHRFDDLIRNIRFPTMTIDEINDCVARYPGLLNESDLILIKAQMKKKVKCFHALWSAIRRTSLEPRFIWQSFLSADIFSTKLTVLNDCVLRGLWIGIEHGRQPIRIEIVSLNQRTKESERLVFTQGATTFWHKIVISLGDSIRLKPNFEYTIIIKYLNMEDSERIVVFCRKENEKLIYNDPEKVQSVSASANLMQIIF